MFNELFAVIAPILICAGLGYGWARRGITYPTEFNYLLALRFQREPGEVAGMVLMSILWAFALLPFIVSYVLV